MNVPNGLARLIKGGCTIEKNDMDYVNVHRVGNPIRRLILTPMLPRSLMVNGK